ncbi:hypothetical protein VTL71DRAFT_745 [Oculimacula yallundae]|uniref:Uncharacterized protein n=1 Tax=Oculimacula yallundae TaxID=86028 RepID=A0ABR4D0Y0_9HELO
MDEPWRVGRGVKEIVAKTGSTMACVVAAGAVRLDTEVKRSVAGLGIEMFPRPGSLEIVIVHLLETTSSEKLKQGVGQSRPHRADNEAKYMISTSKQSPGNITARLAKVVSDVR